jgi:hypothetical protein
LVGAFLRDLAGTRCIFDAPYGYFYSLIPAQAGIQGGLVRCA